MVVQASPRAGLCPTRKGGQARTPGHQRTIKNYRDFMFNAVLPMPPSVNGLFPGKQRRYPSKQYKDWMRVAMLTLREAPKFPDPVRINYTVYFKNKGSGDLSNRLKAVEDILVKRGIIVDDSHLWITDFSMSFGGYDKQNPRIELSIQGRNNG